MPDTKPYPYQAEDVAHIRDMGGRALLAHDPGLGKTVEALLWLKNHAPDRPAVIVCPATIKEQWRREAAQHVGVRAVVLSGTRPGRAGLPPAKLYVINYDVVGAVQDGKVKKRKKTWGNLLQAAGLGAVIIDESRYLMNPRALRTRRVRALCAGVKHVIAMDGTGSMNSSPIEMFPTLNMVRPDLFPNQHAFGLEYCGGKKRFGKWQYKGATNLERLNRKLEAGLMLRRRLQDVMGELPAIARTVVPMELSRKARATYQEARDDFVRWLKTHHAKKARRALKAEELARWGYLKRLIGELKLPAAFAWLDGRLEREKVIVFGLHKKVLLPVAARYGRGCVLVNGSVTGPARQRAIDAFNKDRRVSLLAGHVDAAGVGWSCTSTSSTAFAELAQTPGQHKQAERRVVGQNRGLPGARPRAFYLVAAGTVEEQICSVLERRMRVLDAVLDGGRRSDFNLYAEARRALLEGGG